MHSEKPGTRPRWVDRQLVRRGISDTRVLDVFAEVSRGPFVPRSARRLATRDEPIPIGRRQTVSQPFIIALSLEGLELTGSERVLDVGTGSGFQAVLLSWLVREVYTIEILDHLYNNAGLVVPRFEKAPVRMRLGDGSLGWPSQAPFDGIVVGARTPQVPPSLISQLAPGGRLVIPVGGDRAQTLYQIKKGHDGSLKKKILERVLFVPLLGEEGTGKFPD